MSFPSGSGIILPDDFHAVHQVFSDIVAEPWFTLSIERREQFALSVIDAYRQGHTDPILLAALCREVAQREFGNAANTRWRVGRLPAFARLAGRFTAEPSRR